MKKKRILDNKGITGIDLVTGLIIFGLFVGLITSLMTSIYRQSIEIQKSANAMAYATIVLEKVDEKAFEEIDNDFVTKLANSNEIVIDEGYTIDFSANIFINDLLKKVTVKVVYDINGQERLLTIDKLKVKEIYKND